MKIVHAVLIAATTATASIGVTAPAFAESDPLSLWIATRDVTYAHLAGLTDKQIQQELAMKPETHSF
jgi:hypothetical protein